MSASSEQGARYHRFIGRRAGAVLVAAALIAGVAAWFATKLGLRTAFTELLPSNDPGVVTLHNTEKRLPDMSLLLVGIHSPDPAANERYAEVLTEKIRALPHNRPALATYHIRDVKDFFERNKWLYASEEDLTEVRDRLRKEIGRRKNPLFVDLGGDDEPVSAMEERMAHKDPLEGKFPGGLFTTQDRQYLWIAMLPSSGLFAEGGGEGLLKEVERLIAENPPARYQPAMRVQPGGPVVTGIAERQAVEKDILSVALTCLVVVAVSIWAYFRRLRSIFLVGVPAAIGAAVAFAVAQRAFGYLTSATAFLGPIIYGNGINYAIVLMSRYEEERSRGNIAERAMTNAVNGTWRATAVAALSASVAYASLTVTSFRGFYQFGVMAAVGAVICWLATYSVLPAMLLLWDRGKTGVSRNRAPLHFTFLGRFVGERRGTLLVVFGLMLAASAYGLTHFLHDPFEYDFGKLSSKIHSSDETKQFNQSIDKLFGRWPSPTIILANRVGDVEDVKTTIRRQDTARARTSWKHTPVIGQITTVWDLLPGTLEVQQRKLDLVANIRKLVHDPALSVLNEKERADLNKIDPPETLHLLNPKDLPPIAQRPFTEVDGTVGRVVLVYPVDKGVSVWNGRDLLEIAQVLQYLHLANGEVLETSGSAVVFGAMIRSILRDGPIATLASLIAVLIVVSIMMRPARLAMMALATLLLGVIWMMGAAGWGGVRVTFLNFIALPITFGIGAEYALNIVGRYREDKDIVNAVTSTGAAVALCSWTTIVGYGSLLAASNQAMRGFGLMAILGEVCCLTAAIMALPAVLAWWAGRGRAESSEQKNPPPEPATS